MPLPLYRNKRPRRRRDRRKPKKVLTPYMFFVKEVSIKDFLRNFEYRIDQES
jgi:hypothetical protein